MLEWIDGVCLMDEVTNSFERSIYGLILIRVDGQRIGLHRQTQWAAMHYALILGQSMPKSKPEYIRQVAETVKDHLKISEILEFDHPIKLIRGFRCYFVAITTVDKPSH